MTQPFHRQAWVKINTHVDQGIGELVEALSGFPKLQTMESCEGGPDEPAWISFVYGERTESDELADFVLKYLGPGLVARVGDGAGLILRVTSAGLVLGELTVRPGALKATSEAVAHLSEAFGTNYPRP